jgi:kynurenine aminotransferase
MLSAFMGFLEQGDEVIVFEPFFDQYISNIEMPGGKVVYVPLHPPTDGATKTTSAGEWTFDMKELESKITERTRMVVINTPHNPVGKVFSREELQAIGDLCVKHNILILSDEVYDKLYYVPFTRIATLSPEIAALTLTVGSAGKLFYATGWRVGYLIGPEHLIKYVAAAHTRICFSSVSPLQEATAVAFEQAEGKGFWEESKTEMKGKLDRFNQVWDELGLPVSYEMPIHGRVPPLTSSISVLRARRRLLRPRQLGQGGASCRLPVPSSRRQQTSRFQAFVVLYQGAWRSSYPAYGVLY